MAAGRNGLYDLVILSRPSVSALQRNVVRRYFPQSVVVYDAVHLHFLRDERQLALEPPEDGYASAENAMRRDKRHEIDEIRAADVVSTITGTQCDIVRTCFPMVTLLSCPTSMRCVPLRSLASRDEPICCSSEATGTCPMWTWSAGPPR